MITAEQIARGMYRVMNDYQDANVPGLTEGLVWAFAVGYAQGEEEAGSQLSQTEYEIATAFFAGFLARHMIDVPDRQTSDKR